MNEKEFEKLEQEVEIMLDNEDAELEFEKIQKVFDTYAQHFEEAAEWLRSRSKDSAADECESPDNAEKECDLYETLGVENNEDLEDELEAIAGGRYDEA